MSYLEYTRSNVSSQHFGSNKTTMHYCLLSYSSSFGFGYSSKGAKKMNALFEKRRCLRTNSVGQCLCIVSAMIFADIVHSI